MTHANRPDRRTLANAIRALSMDAVERAQSGHPGMPMGMADIAEVLWNDYLRHNPANPHWWDRDRFILSNGHGSMLQYALLHLSGYDLPLEQLKNFRQLHSQTPGHPEYGDTPGVETTTGPLGQGFANGVGMALAEKLLAARFNRDGLDLVDHWTWVFAGDGCMMEGISHEAASLAGTLGLGKLVCFYDQNQVSIDGDVAGWFTENTAERFRAYNWQVIEAVDGHDPDAIRHAIDKARSNTQRPTLICCRTVIGYGAPAKQGTAATHGAPLGADEVEAARRELGWPHPPFEVPDAIYAAWDARERGVHAEQAWRQTWQDYCDRYPEAASELQRRMAGKLPEDWGAALDAALSQWLDDPAKIATRKASGKSLEQLGPLLPELIGGSADLAGSNNSIWSGSVDVNHDPANGNYIYFGVREFAMTAIASGLALHGGFRPYTATFLVFSDYARNAVRMSALMGAPVVHVYTHDSIGLGEDGPTHQPIEHLASLRMIPGLEVWRPCDAVETLACWRLALERDDGPSALVLSRQGLEAQVSRREQIDGVARGGYVLRDAEAPRAVILATGSEVGPAVAAAEQLAGEGLPVRVVSLPNPERFLRQDADYREAVLPSSIGARIAVEAGIDAYWRSWVGPAGRIVAMTGFGASAPGDDLYRQFGIDAEHIAAAVRACCNEQGLE